MDYDNYTPHEISLASEIADTLKDPEALPFYLQCARKYKEEFLRSRLARVMRVKEEKVKVSRGAIFTSLVKRAPYDAWRQP